MNVDQLLDRVDESAALEFLTKMVQHKSYPETDGERVLAQFMVEQMRSIGLEAALTPVNEARVNAIGTWKGTGGGKSLLFNGHLDTNPVSEGWTVDPWTGKVDDKFIYGIGVSNMKAGDAAYFCAVKSSRPAPSRRPASTAPTPPTSSTARRWRASSAAPAAATTRCRTSESTSPIFWT